MMASTTISICVAILLLLIFAPSNSSCRTTMNSGDTLITSDSLVLGFCGFTMQSDCNLVLYVLGRSVWDTKSYGRGDRCQLELTRNGQLVISNNGVSVWKNSFQGEDDNYVLKLQEDGNVVIFNSNENGVWFTNTSVSCS
ncbi:Mannose-specific lectin [Dendrobium catenatum]|uniref:Mannose-specific lectin n=1 Tax=Dendrobium catenatum TaxID=906689 RepID=A0A2I0WZ59_9ASPA|nr:Mannose-specific lectin [Dendrobium catenatum]